MNLESQVTNLELSKRLKELNVLQESLFYYLLMYDNSMQILFKRELSRPIDHYISAFTAAELLQLLPYHILSKEPEPFNSYRLYISGSVIVKNPECIDPVRIHIVTYRNDTYDMSKSIFENEKFLYRFYDENPANALGKMAIYLIENNLWKPTHEN